MGFKEKTLGSVFGTEGPLRQASLKKWCWILTNKIPNALLCT